MGKLEVQVEAKSSADKIWEAIKETPTLFPKIFPELYKSYDVIEGDGKSVGSVLHVQYTKDTPIVTFAKEKVQEIDEANKLVAYGIIEGELTTLYKNLKASFQVVSKGDGSLVKWSLEYEKQADEVPDPDLIQEFAVKTLSGLDEYLLKA